MNAVLISIKPRWCGKISSGEKTVEIRKSLPKLRLPFKCYIYCTKDQKLQFWTGPRYSYADDHSHNAFDKCGNGKVIGEFICDRLFPIHVFHNGTIQNWNYENMEDACLRYEELANYIGNDKTGYGWHISELYIYDKPIELTEFKVKRPPQSWCYVQEVDHG